MIVEEHGEVAALPVLLRRIAAEVSPDTYVDILAPTRKNRAQLLSENGLENAVDQAAIDAGPRGGVLVLLDADDDCPAELGPALLARARAARPDFASRIRVVLAKAEYEAWFLAAAASIRGRRGVDEQAARPLDPEAVRNAKGWLTARMPPGRRYSPPLHQAAFTAAFDLEAARQHSPSFDKMWRDVTSLLVPPA